MKPTKKNNTKDLNQKENSRKQIDNYFRNVPKPFVVDKIEDPKTTKAFYVKTLHSKNCLFFVYFLFKRS